MQLSEKRIVELARSIAGTEAWSIGCVRFARLLEEEIARAQADARPVAWIHDEGGPTETVHAENHGWEGKWTPLYTHPEASAPGLSEDEWLALAERHIRADWNSEQPDGYLNAVKALVQDAMSLTRASAATVAEPSEEPGWKNERCQYEVCDEEDEHDPRCTAWRDTESQEDSVAAFLSDVASQTPEKPDHWSSCAQCQHNAERAADLLSVQKNTPCGGKP